MGFQKKIGGISVVAIGDLFQLKPVMDNWIFSLFANEYGNLASNLWHDNFTLYDLKKIMRQKNDLFFAELLNRLREGLRTDDDVIALEARIVSETPEMKQIPIFLQQERRLILLMILCFKVVPRNLPLFHQLTLFLGNYHRH